MPEWRKDNWLGKQYNQSLDQQAHRINQKFRKTTRHFNRQCRRRYQRSNRNQQRHRYLKKYRKSEAQFQHSECHGSLAKRLCMHSPSKQYSPRSNTRHYTLPYTTIKNRKPSQVKNITTSRTSNISVPQSSTQPLEK